MTTFWTFLLTMLGAVFAIQSEARSEQHAYILATATTGGTYYPVGVALSTLSKAKLEGPRSITITAITSAGSMENVALMRENQAQFGILQGLYGAWAWRGHGPMAVLGPQTHLRSISMLWQNVEHFVVAAERTATGNLSDLAHFDGAPFSIGARDSGSEGSARTILRALGIDPDRTFDIVHMDYNASADALRDGQIQGFNMPGGVPVTAVTRTLAAAGDRATLLEVSDAELARINGDFNLWSRYVIPAGTYPGLKEEVRTIAQPNFLAVRADLDEDDVYHIVKAIYDNLPFLREIHPATGDMSLNDAIAGLPVPLHPGAARYYEEVGLEIPAHLLGSF